MKSALFAGSFDPPTLGHLSLIIRSSKLFTQLYVGVTENERKTTLFSIEKRISWLKMLTMTLSNVKVVTYTGLTIDAAKSFGADVLLRGARNSCDFENELSLAQVNYKLGNIETLILPADPHTAHISSTLTKQILSSKGSLRGFLPDEVLRDLG